MKWTKIGFIMLAIATLINSVTLVILVWSRLLGQ